MLRTAAKASSVFRRLATSTARRSILNPAISPAIATANAPHHSNFAAHLSQTSFLFFPDVLGQLRGYAPDRRTPDRQVPEDVDDLSDGDMDSEDFEIGDEDFSEDDDEGIVDEDSVNEDEIEDESD